MNNDVEESEADNAVERSRGRRSRAGRIVAGVSVLGLAAVGIVWMQRIPIADHFIAQELAARGVPARYTLTRVGPRTQRLENLVLGDPARPDLTARWIEVDVGYAGFRPAVTRVRASGVRLRGSWQGGILSLGAVDRLMGGGKGVAALPDIDLTLADGRATILTDHGPVGAVLNGTGLLYGGFRGRAALASPRLDIAGCALTRPVGDLAVSTSSGRLSLKGPLRAPALDCGLRGIAVAGPDLGLDIRLAKAFDGASGAITLAANAMKGAGTLVSRPSALVTFDGPFDALAGSYALALDSFRASQVSGGVSRLGGRFAMRADPHDSATSVSGALTVSDLAPTSRAPIDGLSRSVAATPLAPLARQLERAIVQAGRANRLTMTGEARWTGLGGEIGLNKGRFVAESGARLDLTGPARLVVDQARGRWQGEGGIRTGGGGLPDLTLAVSRTPEGETSGTLAMRPYEASGARLALAQTPFRLRADGSGSLRTQVTLDGPLPGGGVRGLNVPVDLRFSPGGRFALADRCTTLRWASLTLSSARFDPAALRLCAPGGQPLIATGSSGMQGGFVLAPLALAGRMGEGPLSLRAESARLDLRGLRFALGDLAVRLGDPAAPTILDAARLEGIAQGQGFAGVLGGAHARIGAVPLDMTGIDGRWTFADAHLALDGAMIVSDTAPERRFFPLSVPDARLVLVDGRIGAEGTLRHPSRDRSVATVKIAHDLGTGSGSATFDVGRLTFGSALQPAELTPLALGVVANVEALVTGNGRIDWTPAGVTSTGQFSTQDAAFAAAFGPVSGFSGTIRFADLLGMRTEPTQEIRIASVNPGIEVRDGVIHYALLSSEQARIEGGRWPFAGGELDLLPATLNLDSRKARNLAFRVTGLDAGAFINTLELKDISATGTYDGLLPMVFDERGGRIEGGILVARQPGLPPLVVEDASRLTVPCDPAKISGTLSYVGQVSNEQLGTFGTMAFEALKNLRYKCLTVLMDGALDGEFVTRVAVNGINQGTPAAARSAFTRPFLGLPFIFNVRVEAPFRGLISTARSFIDPGELIREEMGAQYQTVLNAGETSAETPGLAVQPPASDKGVTKGQE